MPNARHAPTISCGRQIRVLETRVLRYRDATEGARENDIRCRFPQVAEIPARRLP